jgi:hypothetical protein
MPRNRASVMMKSAYFKLRRYVLIPLLQEVEGECLNRHLPYSRTGRRELLPDADSDSEYHAGPGTTVRFADLGLSYLPTAPRAQPRALLKKQACASLCGVWPLAPTCP